MGWLSPRKSVEESKSVSAAPPNPASERLPLPGSPFAPSEATDASAPVQGAIETPLGVTPVSTPEPQEEASTIPLEPPHLSATEVAVPAVGTLDEESRNLLGTLAAEQAALRELFHARLRNDEVQNKSLDRLLGELRDYKENFLRKQMLPLLREVIDCHDLAHRESQRLASGAVADGEVALAGRKTLEVLAQMLRDLLARHDVEAYEAEGTEFDPKSQQCTRTVPTMDPLLDKRIAESIVPGFRSEGTLIRRELVALYKHTLDSHAPAGNGT